MFISMLIMTWKMETGGSEKIRDTVCHYKIAEKYTDGYRSGVKTGGIH